MLRDKIKQSAQKIYSNVIENRRYLHAHPELSFCEYETSTFVKARLDEIGIPWKAMANTGIVGIIQREKRSDQVIALCADMYALPITEANDVVHTSSLAQQKFCNP